MVSSACSSTIIIWTLPLWVLLQPLVTSSWALPDHLRPERHWRQALTDILPLLTKVSIRSLTAGDGFRAEECFSPPMGLSGLSWRFTGLTARYIIISGSLDIIHGFFVALFQLRYIFFCTFLSILIKVNNIESGRL